jgi:hypothetical protein
MSTVTICSWSPDTADSNVGTLVMWPGTPDEVRLPSLTDEAAHVLANTLSGAMKRAVARGRAQVLAELGRKIEELKNES